MQLFQKSKSIPSEVLQKKSEDEAYAAGMIMVVPGKFHTPVEKTTVAGTGGEGKGKHGFDCWHEKSYSRVMQKKNSFLCHLEEIAADLPSSANGGCSSSTGGETRRSCTSTATNGSSHNDHDRHGLRGVFRKVQSMVHRRPHHEDQDWK